jgi:hypothetical protein
LIRHCLVQDVSAARGEETPSGKPQYCAAAVTALLRLIDHVKNDSTRRICCGGMSNSFHKTSRVGSSLKAPPVNCLSISVTACFRLNSWEFRRLSWKGQRVLLTLRSCVIVAALPRSSAPSWPSFYLLSVLKLQTKELAHEYYGSGKTLLTGKP